MAEEASAGRGEGAGHGVDAGFQGGGAPGGAQGEGGRREGGVREQEVGVGAAAVGARREDVRVDGALAVEVEPAAQHPDERVRGEDRLDDLLDGVPRVVGPADVGDFVGGCHIQRLGAEVGGERHHRAAPAQRERGRVGRALDGRDRARHAEPDPGGLDRGGDLRRSRREASARRVGPPGGMRDVRQPNACEADGTHHHEAEHDIESGRRGCYDDRLRADGDAGQPRHLGGEGRHGTRGLRREGLQQGGQREGQRERRQDRAADRERQRRLGAARAQRGLGDDGDDAPRKHREPEGGHGCAPEVGDPGRVRHRSRGRGRRCHR